MVLQKKLVGEFNEISGNEIVESVEVNVILGELKEFSEFQ